ncbi:MAG: hypothetical protein NTW78_01990 [Campylobacterales bacterium]|nr:hypothetical protein [Campylobacterales bacterium]
MSNNNVETLDEKYSKLGKIYHAVVFGKVSGESLTGYLKSSGVLSDEEAAMVSKCDVLMQTFHEQYELDAEEMTEEVVELSEKILGSLMNYDASILGSLSEEEIENYGAFKEDVRNILFEDGAADLETHLAANRLNYCEFSHHVDASGNVVENEKVGGDV